VAYLAPQAAGHTWYPYSFLSPIPQNEPGITSALAVIARLVDSTALGSERVVVLGFSQGGCLALEFAARNARRYAAVVALSGGQIGPPGTPRDYPGSMENTPVFIGCSDVDPHIPVERVRESADVFRRMGAAVDERIYPGLGHTINQDELTAVRALVVG
jgi:predicted esterase